MFDFSEVPEIPSQPYNILHCFKWSHVNCADNATRGAECDLGGYYETRQWKPTLQEATDWCLAERDCMGIVRGDLGYEPRKVSLAIAQNPNAYEAWWCFDVQEKRS